jgi:hypothetical protein
VKYLYDGDCAMCRSLKKVLERQDNRRGTLAFVDISDAYYDPIAVRGARRAARGFVAVVAAPSGRARAATRWGAAPQAARTNARARVCVCVRHAATSTQNMGIEFDEAMETIHAIKSDGTVRLAAHSAHGTPTHALAHAQVQS